MFPFSLAEAYYNYNTYALAPGALACRWLLRGR